MLERRGEDVTLTRLMISAYLREADIFLLIEYGGNRDEGLKGQPSILAGNVRYGWRFKELVFYLIKYGMWVEVEVVVVAVVCC